MIHNRPGIAAVAAGIALALCVTAPPASATPTGRSPSPGAPPAATSTAPGATPEEPGSAAGEKLRPATVTLITGDVVEYTPGEKGGPPATAVRPARRPGGATVTFATQADEDDGGYLVMPSDAAELVAAGTLDEELFDVETLVREDRTKKIPLIVTYGGDPTKAGVAKSADALPAERTRTLGVIDGAAVTVKTSEAAKLWAALQPSAEEGARSTARLAGGVTKVWLDRRLRMSLDQSVPLIGAPTAWNRGLDGAGVKVAVLDTGVDSGHPDLAGRVVASQNFTTAPDTVDRIGHGTHVASTIAGSGAASGGAYKGVAPAASLLAGKVLDDTGNGDTSWAIAGMEWAVAQGADVVNMSLGVCCGDGTDPASQALNELTETHGTLFVTAAGNEGRPQSVIIPAVADRALAVGAVDKVTGTTLAGFSSTGPRRGDAAVKPNIVAPGVGIVAARSSASGVEPFPGNDRYTSFSGTSMATPHVAGAAALLAQQHPGWDADELSGALVSTSVRNDAHNWYQQGAGRLDVGRAVTQTVFADPVIPFGRLSRTQGNVTRQLTYRNTGTAPVTLALTAVTRGWSGGAVPQGAITLGAQSVTVPAGGTATVGVTVDPAAGPEGAYGGWITATAGTARLTTPFSYYTGPATHTLKISLTDSYGAKDFYAPAGQGGRVGPPVYVIPQRRSNSPDDPFHPYAYYFFNLDLAGNGEIPLPGGDYEVVAVANEMYTRLRTSLVVGNVTLDQDRTVNLDARQTLPLRPSTSTPMDAAGQLKYVRTFTDRPSPVTVFAGSDPGRHVELYASQIPSVSAGTMRLTHGWQMEPGVLASATAGSLTLDPAYDVENVRSVVTAATTYPVVDGGQGRPEDLQGLDVTGKLVLVGTPLGTGASPLADATALMEEAYTLVAQRGAAGFIGFYDADGRGRRLPGYSGGGGFLRFGLDATQGRALRTAVRNGPTSLRLTPYTGSASLYTLRYDEPQGAPSQRRTVSTGSLARVDASYHADRAGIQGHVQIKSSAGDPSSEILFGRQTPMPSTRTEYYGPVGGTLWSRVVDNDWLDLRTYDTFSQATTKQERWFKAPLTPGAADLPSPYPVKIPCALCRDGDRFVPAEQWTDSDPRHHSDQYGISSTPHLFVGGTEIPVQGYGPRSFAVPAGTASYRLDAAVDTGRTLSSQVTSSWRFTAGNPSGVPSAYSCNYGPACSFQPAAQLRYDAPVDLSNRAPANTSFTFTLTARPHAAVANAPSVSSAQVEYSVDDGATWRAAEGVSSLGGGRFSVRVQHPALSATNGFVALRVTANDSAGGTVTQTVKRAYALR